MDPVFRNVYQQLFKGPRIVVSLFEFQSPIPIEPNRDTLRRLIESADERLVRQTGGRVRCRADAKLLLLVNFSELIVTPIRLAERRIQVNEIIEHDLEVLMNDAAPDGQG